MGEGAQRLSGWRGEKKKSLFLLGIKLRSPIMKTSGNEKI